MIDLNALWQAHRIMPVITVSCKSGRVLMHGYMNKEAFAYTLKTQKVWYYNFETEKAEMMGERTGNVQKLVKLKADYDCEALLVYVEQVGHVMKKDRGYSTTFVHEIFSRQTDDVSKHRKFGKIEVDKNYDYSKNDYDDEFEPEN